MENNYLLDLTTLITLISDICHDSTIHERFGSLEVWKEKNESIYNHMIDDLDDPVLPKLLKILANKDLYATSSTWKKFNTMINIFGSTKEKERILSLNINVINDDPSIEFQELTDKSWSIENKGTIGTASKNGYTLVTGNIHKLYSALDIDNELKYLAHRSRSFVGKKFEC